MRHGVLALLLSAAPCSAGAPVRIPIRQVELFKAISLTYGTDPRVDAVPDLGEGDHAQVRSGILGGVPIAIKIPYEGLEMMPAWEGEVARRVEVHDPERIFLRASHDPELRVLVMENLAAYRTVDQWAEGRLFSPRTKKRIQAQLERALAALRAAGLVHSDLKPDNVLVGPHARIKVVDFGIAAEEGKYPPYPDHEGWRGGFWPYLSYNQLTNGPAAFADDERSIAVLLDALRPGGYAYPHGR